MGLHQERTHPEFVEGCFGCKIGTIRFGTVPGGAKDSKNQVSAFSRREKELSQYAKARRAGEQPDNTTTEGIEAARRRKEKWDKNKDAFADTNPPEVVKKIEKGYTNVTE